MLRRLGLVALMIISKKASRRARRMITRLRGRAACLHRQRLVVRLADRQRAVRLCRASQLHRLPRRKWQKGNSDVASDYNTVSFGIVEKGCTDNLLSRSD